MQATPAMKAWQAIEDAEILPVILEQLNCQADFIRCAAVSKAWKKASNAVQLQKLSMHFNAAMNPAAVTTRLQWLQQKNRQIQLSKLWDLHMQVDLSTVGTASDHSNKIAVTALFAATGFLSLFSCSLVGNFSIFAALQLLPATLQVLESALPAEVPLSSCDRLQALECLRITTAKEYLGEAGRHDCSGSKYILHQPCKGLQQLEMLRLHGGRFQRPNISWLPRLRVMNVCMTVDQAVHVNINQMQFVIFLLDAVPAEKAHLYHPGIHFPFHVTSGSRLEHFWVRSVHLTSPCVASVWLEQSNFEISAEGVAVKYNFWQSI